MDPDSVHNLILFFGAGHRVVKMCEIFSHCFSGHVSIIGIEIANLSINLYYIWYTDAGIEYLNIVGAKRLQYIVKVAIALFKFWKYFCIYLNKHHT